MGESVAHRPRRHAACVWACDGVYVRDATATQMARALAAVVAAIGRPTIQLPQLGGISMDGRSNEREQTAVEAIASIGAEILAPSSKLRSWLSAGQWMPASVAVKRWVLG